MGNNWTINEVEMGSVCIIKGGLIIGYPYKEGCGWSARILTHIKTKMG